MSGATLQASRARVAAPAAVFVASTMTLAACGGPAPSGDPLPELPPVSATAGPRFEVFCHYACGDGADEALEAADLAWTLVSGLVPLPDSLERPFAVRLYRAEAFRTVARMLARNGLEEGAAFASPQRRTAYIDLVPPVTEAALRRAGLPGRTLRLVAHEAAHLALYAGAGGPPRTPDWVSEGIAQHVERIASAELGLFPGAADPQAAAQAWRAFSLLRTSRLPSLAAILAEGANVAHTRGDYAVRALVFAFLREERPTLWERLMDRVVAGLGDPALPDTMAAIARAHLDGEGESALNAAFAHYVETEAASSRWLQVRDAALAADTLPHAGLPGGRVSVLATDPWRGAAIRVAGSLAFAERTDGEMGLILGRAGRRSTVVAFDPSAGRISVRKETGRGGLSRADGHPIATAALEPATIWTFDVRVTPRPADDEVRIEVRVDGATVIDAALPDGDGAGVWGLYADRGAAGIWSRVTAGGADR